MKIVHGVALRVKAFVLPVMASLMTVTPPAPLTWL
jgi:hypothetical protein